jgi:hypothetical protein
MRGQGDTSSFFRGALRRWYHVRQTSLPLPTQLEELCGEWVSRPTTWTNG